MLAVFTPKLLLETYPVIPILGETLTLYCNVTFEMQAMVTIDAQVTWTLPNGSVITSNNFSKEHNLILDDLKLVDLGEYTCSAMVISNGSVFTGVTALLKNATNISIFG